MPSIPTPKSQSIESKMGNARRTSLLLPRMFSFLIWSREQRSGLPIRALLLQFSSDKPKNDEKFQQTSEENKYQFYLIKYQLWQFKTHFLPFFLVDLLQIFRITFLIRIFFLFYKRHLRGLFTERKNFELVHTIHSKRLLNEKHENKNQLSLIPVIGDQDWPIWWRRGGLWKYWEKMASNIKVSRQNVCLMRKGLYFSNNTLEHDPWSFW